MSQVPEGFPEQVQEARVLRVQPGDVVVAYVRHQLPENEAEAVHDTLVSVWPLNKVLVLDGHMELATVKGGDESGPGPAEAGTGA